MLEWERFIICEDW